MLTFGPVEMRASFILSSCRKSRVINDDRIQEDRKEEIREAIATSELVLCKTYTGQGMWVQRFAMFDLGWHF